MAVSAYILIQTEVGKASKVVEEIRGLDGIVEADDVTGPYDVIVKAAGRHHGRARQDGRLADPAGRGHHPHPHLPRVRADLVSAACPPRLGRRRSWRASGEVDRAGRAAPGTDRPDASQSFGYIEIGVKPGIVFSSLTRNPRPSASSKKKSTRAIASQRHASNARTASARTSAVCGVGERRGHEQLAPCRARTCRRSVELVAGHDLARHRRLRRVVAEHRDLDLAARRSPPRRGSTRRSRARARSRRRARRGRAPSSRRPTSPCSPASRSRAARARPRRGRRTRRGRAPSRSVEVARPAAARRRRTRASS